MPGHCAQVMFVTSLSLALDTVRRKWETGVGNLTFDTARSAEYRLGIVPLGRIPTQEKTAWPDADFCHSCWVSHFWH